MEQNLVCRWLLNIRQVCQLFCCVWQMWDETDTVPTQSWCEKTRCCPCQLRWYIIASPEKSHYLSGRGHHTNRVASTLYGGHLHLFVKRLSLRWPVCPGGGLYSIWHGVLVFVFRTAVITIVEPITYLVRSWVTKWRSDSVIFWNSREHHVTRSPYRNLLELQLDVTLQGITLVSASRQGLRSSKATSIAWMLMSWLLKVISNKYNSCYI